MTAPEGAQKIPCRWPDCLSSTGTEKLLTSCEAALRGEEDADPDLTDYRTAHNCYEMKGF